MYSRIAIASDGSDLGQRGVVQGLELARVLKSEVVFVVVSELFTGITLEGEPPTGLFAGRDALKRASEAAAGKILAKCEKLAEELGVSCELIHVRDKIPSTGILETAEVLNCDLIVMSSHGWRGLGRMLLGSQANEVVARAKIPVLIVK